MQVELGAVIEGEVTGITKFGAFVELPGGKVGMVHISEVAPTYVKEIRDHVTENQKVKVKVLSINDDGKISLSIKQAMQPAQASSNNNSGQSSHSGHAGRSGQSGGAGRPAPRSNNSGYNRRRSVPVAVSPGRPGNFEWQATSAVVRSENSSNFEDMLSKFKQSSDEKISDLKKTMDGRTGGGRRSGGAGGNGGGGGSK